MHSSILTGSLQKLDSFLFSATLSWMCGRALGYHSVVRHDIRQTLAVRQQATHLTRNDFGTRRGLMTTGCPGPGAANMPTTMFPKQYEVLEMRICCV